MLTSSNKLASCLKESEKKNKPKQLKDKGSMVTQISSLLSVNSVGGLTTELQCTVLKLTFFQLSSLMVLRHSCQSLEKSVINVFQS